MPKDAMKIEYVPLSLLLKSEAVRNPKDHDIGAIIVSYQRFGFVAPGVRNETTGRTLVGHGRARGLAEMLRLNMDPPRRINVNPEGEWLVPIVTGIEFESDEEAEAYIIADNELTNRGGWNMPLLHEVLVDLDGGEGLAGTGYDGDDLDELAWLLDTTPNGDGSRDNNMSKAESGSGEMVRFEVGRVMTTIPAYLAEAVWTWCVGGPDQRQRAVEFVEAALTALGVEVEQPGAEEAGDGQGDNQA